MNKYLMELYMLFLKDRYTYNRDILYEYIKAITFMGHCPPIISQDYTNWVMKKMSKE